MIADLAYRRMIDLYYITEKPLDLDISIIAKKIGMKGKEKIISEIISDFFLKSEDGYRSSKCDSVISDYQKKAARAKDANGKRWGKVPSETPLKSDVKSDPNQNQNQEPDIINKETRNPSGFPTIEEAEQFCRGQLIPEKMISLVTDWQLNRERQGWVTGSGLPITNWQADLRSWLHNSRNHTTKKNEPEHREHKRRREFIEESLSIPELGRE
jgi:uncharacterized protein YdaU (DUF1376 family)